MDYLLYVTVLANEFFPKFTSKISSVTPLIGVILTTLLCASPVSSQNMLDWSFHNVSCIALKSNEVTLILVFLKIGQVSEVLKTQGAQLILPVAALHAAAFAIGYWVSRISFGESTSRTISIECGMQVNMFSFSISYMQVPSNLLSWQFHFHLQSSALGFLLAQKHFTNPLVAVPSAVSVVCMAVCLS